MHFLRKKKTKVFCVGRNKTGTTSLTAAMAHLGYKVGKQHKAELLLRDWAKRDFRRLISYCRSADFFQDIPFSLPHTCQAVDMAFPGSKFVLTVRDADLWHASMVNFHQQSSVHGTKALSLESLKDAEYCYKGFAYETKVLVYDLPGDDPYHKETLIDHFHFHNRLVIDYFRNRKEDLLVLDVSKPDAYRQLCAFLGHACDDTAFPWENRSSRA